jgi:hypothetical protein
MIIKQIIKQKIRIFLHSCFVQESELKKYYKKILHFVVLLTSCICVIYKINNRYLFFRNKQRFAAQHSEVLAEKPFIIRVGIIINQFQL